MPSIVKGSFLSYRPIFFSTKVIRISENNHEFIYVFVPSHIRLHCAVLKPCTGIRTAYSECLHNNELGNAPLHCLQPRARWTFLGSLQSIVAYPTHTWSNWCIPASQITAHRAVRHSCAKTGQRFTIWSSPQATHGGFFSSLVAFVFSFPPARLMAEPNARSVVVNGRLGPRLSYI